MWPRRLRLERHRERHALLFNIFSINNPRGFVNITDVTRAAGRVKPRGYAERLARGGNGAEKPAGKRTAPKPQPRSGGGTPCVTTSVKL